MCFTNVFSVRGATNADEMFYEIISSDGKFSSIVEKANGANVSSIQPSGDLKWAYLGKPLQGSGFCTDEMTGSQKWIIKGNLYDEAILRIQFKEEKDFTKLRSYGYLAFWIYTNAATATDLPRKIYLFDRETRTVGVDFPQNNIELGKWNYIKIPVSEFTKETELEMDFKTINRLEIIFPSKLSGEKSGICPECKMGEHTGSESVNYDEKEISNIVDGKTYAYDETWFNIYLGKMGFYMSDDIYAKTFRKKAVEDSLYSAGHLNIGAEGFVTGMIIHPLDSDIRYARTDVGGCYRWEKETNSWKQLMTVIPKEMNNLIGVKSIAADPNNKDILYAFCGQVITRASNGARTGFHDVLKSYDRGESWQRTYLQVEAGGNVGRTRGHGESMAVNPNNSDIVYVGTLNDGLWYTEDGGKAWKKNEAITEWIENLGIDIVLFNDDNIYVSVCGIGLYKSADGGKSFAQIEQTPQFINRIRFVDGVLYAAVSGTGTEAETQYQGGLYKYQNGVWTNMTTGFDGIGDFVVSDEYIVVSGEPWGVTSAYYLRSLDNGQTWDKFKADHGLFGCCCLVQNPDDNDSVFAATGEGLMLIKNLTGQLPNTEENALSYDPVMDENGRLSYEKADEQRVDDGTIMYLPAQKGIEMLVGQKLMSVPDKAAPLLQIGCYDRGFVYTETLTSLAIKGHDDGNLGGGMPTGMDYCAEKPEYVMRAGRELKNETGGYVILSTDYGRYGVYLRDEWGWKFQSEELCQQMLNKADILLCLLLRLTVQIKVMAQYGNRWIGEKHGKNIRE